jgi:hypothetical protein
VNQGQGDLAGDFLARPISHDVADVFKHLAHQCNGFGLMAWSSSFMQRMTTALSCWLHSSTAVVDSEV